MVQTTQTQLRAESVCEGLKKHYPDTTIALDFSNPLQLLVATILSAQCTDVRVNRTTPAVFAAYQSAEDYSRVAPEDLEQKIRPTGFFRQKTKSIIGACQAIIERHGGEIPQTMEELSALPGVGRKTANVMLGVAFGKPGIVVDTHVKRLSRRLGFTRNANPTKIEFDLQKLLPEEEWTAFSNRLIFHGRQVCKAQSPQCDECFAAKICPAAGKTSPRAKARAKRAKKAALKK